MTTEVRGAQIADGTYLGVSTQFNSDGTEFMAFNADGTYNAYTKDPNTGDFNYTGTYNADGSLNGTYQPDGSYHEYIDGGALYNVYDPSGKYVDTRNHSDDSLNGKFNADFTSYTEYNADGTTNTFSVSGGSITSNISPTESTIQAASDTALGTNLLADASIIQLPPPGFVSGVGPSLPGLVTNLATILSETSHFFGSLRDSVNGWPNSDPTKESTLDLLSIIDQGLAAITTINYQMETTDAHKKADLEAAMFDKMQEVQAQTQKKMEEIKAEEAKAKSAQDKASKWGMAAIVIGVLMTAISVALDAVSVGLASPLVVMTLAFTAAAIADQASGGKVSKWTLNIIATLSVLFAQDVCGVNDPKELEKIDASVKLVSSILIALFAASRGDAAFSLAVFAEVAGMMLVTNNPTAEFCDIAGAGPEVTLAMTILSTVIFMAIGAAGAKADSSVMSEEEVQAKLDSLSTEAERVAAKKVEIRATEDEIQTMSQDLERLQRDDPTNQAAISNKQGELNTKRQVLRNQKDELKELDVTNFRDLQIQYYELALKMMKLGGRGTARMVNGLQSVMQAPITIEQGILQSQMSEYQGDIQQLSAERDATSLVGKQIIDRLKKILSQIATAMMVFVDAIDSVEKLNMRVIKDMETPPQRI